MIVIILCFCPILFSCFIFSVNKNDRLFNIWYKPNTMESKATLIPLYIEYDTYN